MLGRRLHRRAVACLALLLIMPQVASGQGRPPKKQAARSSARSKSTAKPADRNAPAADRVVLRDGKELLGQVVETSPSGGVVILVRRDWVRAHLPDQIKGWEDAEKAGTARAVEQRHQRLLAWRQDRPPVPLAGDRITPWIDRELSAGDAPLSTLMSIKLGRGDVAGVQRPGEVASRALGIAWLLGLPEPESAPLATLLDAIAGRGGASDEPVALDRLLPPSAEPEDRWLLRRAATEALHDDGLRFVRIGNTVLPEPAPGQPPDPTLGATLVDGTIRDVLTGGRAADPLPSKLGGVADRGRVGAMVTRVELSADLGSVSAESALYARGTGGWERVVWRSGGLQVGEMPAFVTNAVAADPQVKSLLDMVDAIGGGLIPQQMKQRGLAIGTTVGGAAVMASAALTRALAGLAFDVTRKDEKAPKAAPATNARTVKST